jgi:hypothetical protein
MNVTKKKPSKFSLNNELSNEMQASHKDITVSIVVTTISILLSVGILILVSIMYSEVLSLNGDVSLDTKSYPTLISSSNILYSLDSCLVNCKKQICDKKTGGFCDGKNEEDFRISSIDNNNSDSISLINCWIPCINFLYESKKVLRKIK